MSKAFREHLIVSVILVIGLVLLKAALERSVDKKDSDALKIEEAINIARNKNLKLTGYYQSITVEDSVVPFAMSRLGMIKNSDTLGTIIVQNDQKSE
ncbi:MAG: hypothetical protein L6Q47_09200 [Ignavibacteriaceae bacterium]|nr:hypothetical protein [Ignavibacteriaceae bacterium]